SCSNPCFDPRGFNTPSAQQYLDYIYQHRFVRANYDWVVHPTLLFHLTAGANKQWINTEWNFWNKGFPAKLGITNVLPQGPFPNVQVPPFTPLGSGTGNGMGGGVALQSAESLTWVRGKHTFKFGAENSFYYDGGEGPGSSGVFNFN